MTGKPCKHCAGFCGDSGPTCEERYDAIWGQRATQPPHHGRGDVEQRARELLAAEYRTHGWHEDAGRLCMGGETTTFVEDDALRVVGRLLEEGDEDSHVITELGRMLAKIAVTLKGPEPAGTAWSYHDLPAMVAALTEAKQQSDLPFATTQQVVRALFHLGYAAPEGQEEQAARANELVLTLCREVMEAKQQGPGEAVCRACNGVGEVEGLIPHASGDPQDDSWGATPCATCNGTGEPAHG